MARIGLIGPSYQSQSVNADAQLCMNLYPEVIESGFGKSAMVLYSTPGLIAHSTLTDGPVRGNGTYLAVGRVFAVSGSTLFEVLANGTNANLGNVGNDNLPVSMADNGTQLLICSAGKLYILTLATNVLTSIATFGSATAAGSVSLVGYSDGYFLALIQNAYPATFWISNLLDGTTWDAAKKTQISVYPDGAVSMLVDHRQPWFFGQKASNPYYNTGSSTIPFSPISGAFIEQGGGAAFATNKLDNTIFFLGTSNLAGGIAWRIQGNIPQRISTHAVEQAWSLYSTISDAVAFTYQDQGHAFWVINFPSGNATWVYDVATGMWHQRGWFNSVTNSSDAHLANSHVFAFGYHLVGDRSSGKIYRMQIPQANGSGGWNYCDDAGHAIQRIRRSPHVGIENQWVYHSRLDLILESGLGPQPPLLDGLGAAREPQINLRWSNDGGHSWGNYHTRGCGFSGQFGKQIYWNRLGRARDRVYELSMTDAVPWRIIDGYLTADPGYAPEERLGAKLSKSA